MSSAFIPLEASSEESWEDYAIKCERCDSPLCKVLAVKCSFPAPVGSKVKCSRCTAFGKINKDHVVTWHDINTCLCPDCLQPSVESFYSVEHKCWAVRYIDWNEAMTKLDNAVVDQSRLALEYRRIIAHQKMQIQEMSLRLQGVNG